jgi:hypothetical protein
MMSRMVPKPFSLVSHSWILSRLRLSLRAVNESSKTPAVFLWATVKTWTIRFQIDARRHPRATGPLEAAGIRSLWSVRWTCTA